MLNYKSILFKEKYYSISFKLKFILKSNLNIRYNNNYIFRSKAYKYPIYCKSKFLFDKFKCVNKSEYIIQYYTYGKHENGNDKHESDKPATIKYYSNGNVEYKIWCLNGIMHRKDKPARIKYYINGRIKSKEYYWHNKLYNDNEPAKIKYYDNGNVKSEAYYIIGNYLGRNYDEPSKIKYYINGNIMSEEYYENGLIHRGNDQPAKIEYAINGDVILELYYFYGDLYTFNWLK